MHRVAYWIVEQVIYIVESFMIETSFLCSPSGVNAPGLPGNWFWRVGSVAYRFYGLEPS